MSSTQKIVVITIVCALAILLAVLAFEGLDRFVFHPILSDLGVPWATQISSIWFVAAAVFLLPGRYTALPIPIEIRGSADIYAISDDVWNVIEPRPRDTYWGAAITHTTGIEGEPERLDFHFDSATGSDGKELVLQAVIENIVPDEYFALGYLNTSDFPGMGADLVRSEFFIEPIDGGTRVTQIEYLARLRLTAIPMLMFLNPARDALLRLKALIEDTVDESWMGKAADRLSGTDD